MKKLLFVLFFAAIAFAGCKKEEAQVAPESAPAATEAPATPAAPETPAAPAAPEAPAAPATK